MSKPDAVVVRRGGQVFVMQGGNTIKSFPIADESKAFAYANNYRAPGNKYVQRANGSWTTIKFV